MKLKVENVEKNFKSNKILNSISFNIKQSEIVGVIGPSGAGKTTLIKIIMGMEKADNGLVELLGYKIPNREVLGKIGYMAQADALYLDLSAKENLKFFGQMYLVPKKELVDRIKYLAKLLNLEDHLNKKVKSFSGGMKRRLSLALTLLQNPEFLILDEPTVGIDPQLRLDIWEELNKFKAKGKSILVTTHVMDEAEKCDRIILLGNGEILEDGSPKELKDKYGVASVEEVFLKVGSEKE
ncbi:ABC transporter ATP-binding protein [uncultured Clostridium sp.]|jgi:ABC-2 type transport system ATP-binding protein|uniref:ABC transporter ATP-binding protein n=1 Tax=uncultured Clostridium sp. TaxID=59620 RepID=UPI00260B94CA|nr:ABC transporter ATP-binding protein [uncultured Clostridium sp.]